MFWRSAESCIRERMRMRFRRSVQELTPDQVALLVSVGLVLGVFPIMGCPNLCLPAAGDCA